MQFRVETSVADQGLFFQISETANRKRIKMWSWNSAFSFQYVNSIFRFIPSSSILFPSSFPFSFPYSLIVIGQSINQSIYSHHKTNYIYNKYEYA
jgi:hypothetical protein